MSASGPTGEFDLCSLDELRSRGVMTFEFVHPLYGRHEIALFLDGDLIGALDNFCPHEGAMLSYGMVASGELVCPLHGAVFDLQTGKCLDNYTVDAESYETEIRDGRIWLKAPGEKRFTR